VNLKGSEFISAIFLETADNENCGYIHEGIEAPEECPACRHLRAYYELLDENR